MNEALLEGLIVLDMSQFLSGPFAALRLGDLGARVIKIERPDGGDLCRRLYLTDTEIGGDSTLFHAINRGKLGFAADFKNTADVAAVKSLVGKADVIIQNFRPGVVERLGLDRFAAEKGAPVTLWKPVGCAACNHTGYLGRTMVIEVLPVTDAIRGLILQHAEAREIQRVAIAEGMVTMFQHGMQKALAGITTPEEVLRVTRDV